MNAKEEFLETVKSYIVIGATISIERFNSTIYQTKLNPGYTQEEYNNFLNSINIVYDDGFGSQELFGLIFRENNIWFDRGEYDGSEWWEKHQYPSLIESFDEKIVVQYERSKKLERIIK